MCCLRLFLLKRSPGATKRVAFYVLCYVSHIVLLFFCNHMEFVPYFDVYSHYFCYHSTYWSSPGKWYHSFVLCKKDLRFDNKFVFFIQGTCHSPYGTFFWLKHLITSLPIVNEKSWVKGLGWVVDSKVKTSELSSYNNSRCYDK